MRNHKGLVQPWTLWLAIAVSLCASAACTYDARFEDCTVRCGADGSCPPELACGAEGLCRDPAAALETCAPAAVAPPSCIGLPATCGADHADDCCSIATPIPGGTFFRSYDRAADGLYPDPSYPATVSAFDLDKYEVTVGRFRAFVAIGGGTQAQSPAAGTGAHPTIPGSGWDPSWDGALAPDAAALKTAIQCDALYQTLTADPGPNEELPINCVTWYEAAAFCAWDGGYLPTEAEWNFAAAGGAEQRAYPWSDPPDDLTIDCAHANYFVGAPAGPHCGIAATGMVSRVGSTSPAGDGPWHQADLAGNVWEWTLDWYVTPYPTPTCVDCATLDPGSSCPACPVRSVRGGSFVKAATEQRTAARGFSDPTERTAEFGVRCARNSTADARVQVTP